MRHFGSRIQRGFLHEFLRCDKFVGPDFKNDKSFSKFQLKIPKQGIFGPNFKDFLTFAQN